MKKGKTGILLSFYAVAAFILALFGESLAVLAITLFVLVVEKDEWTSRQCIQALGAIILENIVRKAVGLLEEPFAWIGSFSHSSDYHEFLGTLYDVLTVITDIVEIILIILIIASAIKVSKQKEANFPIVSGLSNWAYGIVMERVPNPMPQQQMNNMAGNMNNMANNKMNNNMPNNNMNNNMINNNMNNANVAQSQMNNNGVKKCPKCGADVTGKFCNKCGSKVD